LIADERQARCARKASLAEGLAFEPGAGPGRRRNLPQRGCRVIDTSLTPGPFVFGGVQSLPSGSTSRQTLVVAHPRCVAAADGDLSEEDFAQDQLVGKGAVDRILSLDPRDRVVLVTGAGSFGAESARRKPAGSLPPAVPTVLSQSFRVFAAEVARAASRKGVPFSRVVTAPIFDPRLAGVGADPISAASRLIADRQAGFVSPGPWNFTHIDDLKRVIQTLAEAERVCPLVILSQPRPYSWRDLRVAMGALGGDLQPGDIQVRGERLAPAWIPADPSGLVASGPPLRGLMETLRKAAAQLSGKRACFAIEGEHG
jgi:hypothetical protein